MHVGHQRTSGDSQRFSLSQLPGVRSFRLKRSLELDCGCRDGMLLDLEYTDSLETALVCRVDCQQELSSCITSDVYRLYTIGYYSRTIVAVMYREIRLCVFLHSSVAGACEK